MKTHTYNTRSSTKLLDSGFDGESVYPDAALSPPYIGDPEQSVVSSPAERQRAVPRLFRSMGSLSYVGGPLLWPLGKATES
jgi:hypothetical protein